MRKSLIIAGLVFTCLLGALVYLLLAPAPSKYAMAKKVDPHSIRTTELGKVVGYADFTDTHAWLGIPYAQPPVGDWRWRAPRAPVAWQGIREALGFCSPCVQYGGILSGVPKDLYGQVVGSEDCLYLNIWAPRFTPDTVPQGNGRLPVMVWIHGGGNSIGSAPMYRMVHNIAGTHKLIVVTVNYRLGVLGWFYHPALNGENTSPEDRSGNYGTLDIIQALRWVQQNITAFGGDPSNVTVFGESAGGWNVYSLLASPLAKGLFHRAISQSGGLMATPLSYAENFSDDAVPGHPASSRELLNNLLITDNLARDRAQAKAYQVAMSPHEISKYLRGKSPTELLSPFKPGAFGMYWQPFIFRDGTVLPKMPMMELFSNSSQYNSVPVILGTNRDEYKLFMAQHPELVKKLFGIIPRIRDLKTYNRVTGYFSDLLKAQAADEPAALMRDAQGPNVYVYRFDWDEEPDYFLFDLSELLGACHGLEMFFVFRTFDSGKRVKYAFTKKNYPGRKKLSDAMSSYWAQFAYNGDPGRGRHGDLREWKPWDNSNPGNDKFIVFDTEKDGGIRMSSETVTSQDIKDRLIQDQNLIGSQEELCRLYAHLFKLSLHPAYSWNEEEYLNFGEGGCKSYPPEMFR